MSNLRIERYVPDLNEWMDITDFAKDRFPGRTFADMADAHARMYEMDVRVIQFKVIHESKGHRE